MRAYVCVWNRTRGLTLRGCRDFVVQGESQCGPGQGEPQLVLGMRLEQGGKPGYGPFHQEQGL